MISESLQIAVFFYLLWFQVFSGKILFHHNIQKKKLVLQLIFGVGQNGRGANWLFEDWRTSSFLKIIINLIIAIILVIVRFQVGCLKIGAHQPFLTSWSNFLPTGLVPKIVIVNKGCPSYTNLAVFRTLFKTPIVNKREIDESKLLGKRGASSYLIYAVSVLFCVHGKRKSQIKIDFTKAEKSNYNGYHDYRRTC